ncbi:MAG: 16S rRNA (cytidine(1402)-2'-O)-methyltransferase [Candidatus Taylorbacteria bacterium]|nr:16S rRNA (cytidine(1402)-2'-O)-methyltransferase [Candidatus Taylorbacteria bacterium]
MGTLFVVGTPIGNLEDVTLRALRVLKEVDVILCEDTRVTKRLLEKYQIQGKQLATYNDKKSGLRIEKIVELLQEGKNLALVTDAGTPGISDPGSLLVSKIREALPDVTIVPIPGANAAVAALSAAGVPASDFLFLGFLPHKKGRETLFKEIAASKRTVVFYESPHRILKTLESLKTHLEVSPPSERKVVIARELTKIHEEVVSGMPAELLEFFKINPEKARGEFVVIVS